MMDQQLFGAGFRVFTESCRHRVTLEIESYESACVSINPNGALTFECTDIALLFSTDVPTRVALRNTAGLLGALFGAVDIPEGEGEDGPDQHDTKVMLFTDELSLEMWLSSEFLPGLDVFAGEEGEELDEEARTQIGKLTKDVMVDVLGNKAKNEVRRSFG